MAASIVTATGSDAAPPRRRPTSAERRLFRSTPRLDARFPVLLRGDGTVQIGMSPALAVVVRPPDGFGPRCLAALLRQLDGSTRLDRALRRTGLPLAHAGPILDELTRAGLLTLGPEERVPRSMVTVHGAGPLADRLREHLPAIGVQVRASGTHPDDEFAVEAAASSVTILAGQAVVEPGIRRMLHEAAMPHLHVRLRDGSGVVGPVVLPGRTACLGCGDLHRRDRDPAWPRLMVQQMGRRGHGDAPTVMVTVGVTADLLRTYLLAACRARTPAHGVPTGCSHQVEVGPGGTSVTAFPWLPHPECPCRAARHATAGGAPGNALNGGNTLPPPGS
ncbi:cyclodehydratase [Tomitella cavernea]|uniref:Bacteriocin biosynthesis cyclodehydratase domain-containing protein n=1 Tax=Tomitella cavernea TaxID=1387982 RepID=A0ABP9CYD8_9ACTN